MIHFYTAYIHSLHCLFSYAITTAVSMLARILERQKLSKEAGLYAHECI